MAGGNAGAGARSSFTGKAALADYSVAYGKDVLVRDDPLR